MEDNKSLIKTIKKFDVKTMPPSSFNLYLGKRRSGKTILCEYLLSQLYYESLVDCIFLFSPTNAGFDFIEADCRFDNIDLLDNIINNYEIFNEYNKLQPHKSKQIKLRTAVVIDDCATDLKSKDFNILEELSVLGRHKAYPPLSLSFHILCQSLTKIPRVVRLNSDIIFMNQIASMKEVELVTDENLFILASSMDEKKKARQLYYDLVGEEDFQFIACCNYKQNCREYSDYIYTYKAILDKNGKVRFRKKR